MTRINLLDETVVAAHPRAGERAWWGWPTALLSMALAAAALWMDYQRSQRELERRRTQLATLQAELARLSRLRQQVAQFEQQKAAIDRQIAQIARLEEERIDGEYLLEAVAATVARSPRLWLTTLSRKQASIRFEGQAASLESVAQFVRQLSRCGAFEQIEIRQAARQPGSEPAVFQFELTAQFRRARGADQQAAGEGQR